MFCSASLTHRAGDPYNHPRETLPLVDLTGACPEWPLKQMSEGAATSIANSMLLRPNYPLRWLLCLFRTLLGGSIQKHSRDISRHRRKHLRNLNKIQVFFDHDGHLPTRYGATFRKRRRKNHEGVHLPLIRRSRSEQSLPAPKSLLRLRQAVLSWISLYSACSYL